MRPWPILLLSTLCVSCAAETGPEPPAGPRPDIVLVTIDTLRADHLELYGYDQETAPFLSELAREGVVFRRAYSTSSWTAPSTASLFTGLYPPRHGVTTGYRAQHNEAGEDWKEAEDESIELIALPSALPTLPECLQAAGYATYGVAANINIGERLGFARGFDRFELLHKDDAPILLDTLLGWLDEGEGAGPRFLYLHINDVHKPYAARAPWYAAAEGELEDTLARYDSEIRAVDAALERLHAALDLRSNTILAVVSDHGEEFDDHGDRGHKFSLYRELNQVAFVLRAPGLAPRTVDVNVSLVDVLPTLLELASVPDGDERTGRSLVPLLGGGAGDARAAFEQRTLFAHRTAIRFPEPLWAALHGSYKLIENDKTGERLLFDLASDPGEKSDILDLRPDLAAQLGASLAAFRETRRLSSAEAIQVDLSEPLREHLDVLGYTGDDE